MGLTADSFIFPVMGKEIKKSKYNGGPEGGGGGEILLGSIFAGCVPLVSQCGLLIMHLSMLSRGKEGGGGGARGWRGDFDKEVAFDFMDWPQGADIWFFPFPFPGSGSFDSSIYSRKTGYELFCFKMAAIANVVQEEEVCNLIELMRSSIHPPLFLTSVRQLRCEV